MTVCSVLRGKVDAALPTFVVVRVLDDEARLREALLSGNKRHFTDCGQGNTISGSEAPHAVEYPHQRHRSADGRDQKDSPAPYGRNEEHERRERREGVAE